MSLTQHGGEEWPLHGCSAPSLPACSPALQNLSRGRCGSGHVPNGDVPSGNAGTAVPATTGAGTGAAEGWWGSRTPVGAGSSWCGCPAAFLQHIPLRPRMRSVISKAQGQARIQRGPRPPGRVRLWGCGRAGAQERRGSGSRGDGGLDQDDAWPCWVGAQTAPAASLCQWAWGDGGTRGSPPADRAVSPKLFPALKPLQWGFLHPIAPQRCPLECL